MHVRLAMPEDLDALLSMAELQVAETFSHLGFDRDRAAATFWGSVETGDPTCFVAEADGEVVGFLVGRIDGYDFTSGVFVNLDVLLVRPDKRGTRAAVKLLREYIRWGKIVGAREILFGVSSGYRVERTSRLYEHLGAERIGTQHRIVRA
jgi:GNAT superfamily N-acetyltransferase